MPGSGAKAGHCGRSAGGMAVVTSRWHAGWTVQVRNLMAQTSAHFPSASPGSVCVRAPYKEGGTRTSTGSSRCEGKQSCVPCVWCGPRAAIKQARWPLVLSEWLLSEPSSRRVGPQDVQRYRRLARRGRSARAIARRCGRSHATVNRWLARDVVVSTRQASQ
jgi:Helix-turn-helix domain